ncbi:aromatic amino acid hydroxylase [Urechidicola vernalis]|uniref:Aromatic amino acid hydroxylase n=1 Tax=Urechidicola vernalis TaxID=3075600 RepID=A0ABU2Y6G8_9FLAO|nr:aromatic amino acid hydroxylase [Urechidicola sp. P050]MDT0553406.1 aromatic amino acid hydroxylase [Urechidicola sp. P050]
METHFEFNEVTKKLPFHLHKFIVRQPYEEYTAQNHAVWRYVMRLNVDYLSKVAHNSYVKGLDKVGITIDEIPRMEGMNRILSDIGWAAVSVDGFIPPNAFMEFQAYNVLVVASDMRTIEHIEYTPAPDIIHESAGHAPIIANPEYAEYLRRFGEIGSKAISSKEDYDLYEAIRLLSILKENPNSIQSEIDDAQKNVIHIQNNMGEPSEMAQIRNLHWWTVEYGLIGTVDDPKIYGAGLLSSIGESEWCLQDKVKKMPYNVEVANVGFDITKPQPQLFVTPDFAHLSLVLNQFANSMAIRTGGKSSVEKLINSENLGTIELSTGIQISGIFTEVIDNKGVPVYIKTSGPTALAYREKELIGHGIKYHADGFGSPVGKLKGMNLAIEDMSPKDLEVYGLYEGKQIKLEFEGDITVEGEIITGQRNLMGKIILISFKNCTVKHGDEFLFKPEWGIYDMAIGKEVVSGFSGPAALNSFEDIGKVSTEKTIKIKYSEEEELLFDLYQQVRDMRLSNNVSLQELKLIFQNLEQNYGKDWLLALEIYELLYELRSEFKNEVLRYLESMTKHQKLINNGLRLIHC